MIYRYASVHEPATQGATANQRGLDVLSGLFILDSRDSSVKRLNCVSDRPPPNHRILLMYSSHSVPLSDESTIEVPSV